MDDFPGVRDLTLTLVIVMSSIPARHPSGDLKVVLICFMQINQAFIRKTRVGVQLGFFYARTKGLPVLTLADNAPGIICINPDLI